MKRLFFIAMLFLASAAHAKTVMLAEYVTALERIHSLLSTNQLQPAKTEATALIGAQIDATFHADDSLLNAVAQARGADPALLTRIELTLAELRNAETAGNAPDDKLVAVLSHDKYERDLRVEAAWSLIEMPKRGGQAIGLTRLIEELNKLAVTERREILDGVWKRLRPKVEQPLQKAGASGHPYGASKAGVISLVQTTAYSLSGTGVRINAVCPGLIETGMTKPVFDRAKERGTQDKIGQLNPLKRPGQPHELAAMGLFLASDDASYVNGQAIPVDGGLTASMPTRFSSAPAETRSPGSAPPMSSSRIRRS
jgi:hypothetical protein